MARMIVVLPEPLGPTMPKMVPLGMSSVSAGTISTLPRTIRALRRETALS